MLKRFKHSLQRFFFPPGGLSPRKTILLGGLLVFFAVLLLLGGVSGYTYTDSPKFCGTACHTMPPQNIAYLDFPHANVYCTECHIGRSGLGTQITRKIEDVREVYAMVFHTYTYPIQASRSRPARETCEKCHHPESFSGR